MKRNISAMPEFFSGFVLPLLISLFFFAACITNAQRQRSTITFQNNTPFRVNISVGTMRTELEPIEPQGTLTVPNIYSDTEVYYLSFDIQLVASSKNYDLTGIRPVGSINHIRIGSTVQNQTISIPPPAAFDIRDSYIVISNNSRIGGVHLSEDSSAWLNCIHEHSKNNIDQNETEVFRVTPKDNKTLYITGSVNVPFPTINYKAGFVYYFDYDGDKVTLNDFRPLHRVGETSWAYPVNNANYPAQFVEKDGKIYSFAPTNRELILTVYDSAGNVIKTVSCDKRFNITHASIAGDNFLVTGYERTRSNAYRPVAKILGEDGSEKFDLTPSTQPENSYALFNTAAKNNSDTWLLAGGSANHPSLGYTAYIRLVRETNGRLTVIKEMSGSLFQDNSSGNKRGEIKSAVYDHTADCWIVTGENIETNNTVGSFVARINDDGMIDKMDFSSFSGILFNKIIADKDGVYFLSGEEQIGNETYAVLYKYNINNRNKQKLSGQIPSHSYYHDMVFDKENNCILLSGVMQAKTETGKDGTPFIESINLENNALSWRKLINDSKFRGTALAATIIQAVDYGFVISLSGMDDYYKAPFIIARVNSQGKYIE